MSKFSALYKKAGGKEILRQYARAHVLFYALFQTLLQGFSKKSLEIVRLSVQNKILKKLRKKYKKKIENFAAEIDKSCKDAPHENCGKIWFCWFQGLENAPQTVKTCYNSLKENIRDREIIVITEENFGDYVEFPDYILEKYKKGVISRTHFSDLLRLELLIKYGGSWIDSTVYCSGGEIPSYMLGGGLFLFRDLKPGLDGHAVSISNWFITADSGDKILMLTRDLLYAYWKKSKLTDYFIFHDFFELATERYPEEWGKVIPFPNSAPHILLLRLFEPYNAEIWEAVRGITPFHKLTYKFTEEQQALEGTFYSEIVAK